MKQILIIEDEPFMRQSLITALQTGNFGVIEARDGFGGLELARAKVPDLIVCDVTMPGKDGYEVLRELKADAKTSAIPFIFLTGKAERSDFRAGMNLGADDYLTKPVSTEELLAAITTRLQRELSRERHTTSALNPGEWISDFSSPKPLQALGLTPREAEVLLWVAQGKTNPEVAVILGIRHRTVKKHLEHVFAKLGVETRTAASRTALELLTRQMG
jgi:DNA-binding NarL/FixJ family response regulator